MGFTRSSTTISDVDNTEFEEEEAQTIEFRKDGYALDLLTGAIAYIERAEELIGSSKFLELASKCIKYTILLYNKGKTRH